MTNLDVLVLGNRIWCSLNDIGPCNSAWTTVWSSTRERWESTTESVRRGLGTAMSFRSRLVSPDGRARVADPHVFVNRTIYSRHHAATNRPCVDRGPVTTIESEIAPRCVASRAMRRPIGGTRAAERRTVSKGRKLLFANWSHRRDEVARCRNRFPAGRSIAASTDDQLRSSVNSCE